MKRIILNIKYETDIRISEHLFFHVSSEIIIQSDNLNRISFSIYYKTCNCFHTVIIRIPVLKIFPWQEFGRKNLK